MNVRSNYSLNGVYRCENLAELVRLEDFPRVPLGPLGGIGGWYLKLRFETDRTILYPFISCYGKPDLVLRFFFNIIKGDGSSAFEVVAISTIKAGFGPKGLEMSIHDLLNEDNGYLDDDGALAIEYGVHVDDNKCAAGERSDEQATDSKQIGKIEFQKTKSELCSPDQAESSLILTILLLLRD
ncbi:unnamed protein product [Caenorhabditis brenneri]